MLSLRQWLKRLRYRWIRFKNYREGYSKILYEQHADPQNNHLERELIWAKYLGDGLYQLENLPLANELNLHDVVRCREDANGVPAIIEIVRRSGNRTLRVSFKQETPTETALKIMAELRTKRVFYEKVGPTQFLFNIEPSTDYEWIKSYLKSKEDEGLLWLYE